MFRLVYHIETVRVRGYFALEHPQSFSQFKNSRIQASRDTLMSEMARSLQEDILAKKTQERLGRHLAADGMDAKIHGSILRDAAP